MKITKCEAVITIELTRDQVIEINSVASYAQKARSLATKQQANNVVEWSYSALKEIEKVSPMIIRNETAHGSS